MRIRRADSSSAVRGLFAAVLATALLVGAACTDDSDWEGAPPDPTLDSV